MERKTPGGVSTVDHVSCPAPELIQVTLTKPKEVETQSIAPVLEHAYIPLERAEIEERMWR